jgi:hypothetical protein
MPRGRPSRHGAMTTAQGHRSPEDDPGPGARPLASVSGALGYRGADVETSRSLPTGEITELLESGVEPREIVRRMVATGDWSEAGAVGFVSFLTHGPDAPARVEHAGRRGETA